LDYTRAISIAVIVLFFPFLPHDGGPSIQNGTIPPKPIRPNVLLIMLDDAGAQYMDIAHTPNIDRLAVQGRRYTMAFSNSTGCNPSRVSFATGLLPTCVDTMSQTRWRKTMNACQPGLGDQVKTMYRTFGEAGYQTLAVGKIMHQGWQQDAEFNESTFYSPLDIMKNVVNNPLHGLSEFYASGGEFKDWGRVEDLRGANGETYTETDLTDYKIASEAIGKIPNLSRPFFAAVGFTYPHLPRYVPGHLLDKYMGVPVPDVLMNDADDMPRRGRIMSAQGEQNQLVMTEILAHKSRWREFNAAYYASLEFADQQIGRVLAAAPENTVVVLWSDHGYHLGQKLKIEKGTLWRESYHVPLIVAGPGVKPAVIDDVTNSTEVYTMLLDMAGLVPTDGIDRAPVSDGFIAFNGHVAIDDGKYAYIQYADAGEREFYNMQVDSMQWRNINEPPISKYRQRLFEYAP